VVLSSHFRLLAFFSNLPGDSLSDTRMTAPDDSKHISALRPDLITASVLVWIATAGRDADLTSDAHLFFSDRYQRLADFHRQHACAPASNRGGRTLPARRRRRSAVCGRDRHASALTTAVDRRREPQASRTAGRSGVTGPRIRWSRRSHRGRYADALRIEVVTEKGSGAICRSCSVMKNP
jgi:hypothetical protein